MYWGPPGDARDILDILKPIRHLAQELFGVAAAHASDVTAGTTTPLTLGGAVVNKIENLNFWQSGGAIVSEGLMWAWRTLSPNAPFADRPPTTRPASPRRSC